MGQGTSFFNSSVDKDVVMIGLDGAGKTTVLNKECLNEPNKKTIPTIGFNVQTLKLGNGVNLKVWDMGGQTKIREQWKHCYQATDAIIYLIDSSDKDRLDESLEILQSVILDLKPSQVTIPILLLLNKIDLIKEVKSL